MEYHITTEWTISHEPATRTARHRRLQILRSEYETKQANANNYEVELSGM
jgi:hypothetical protein